MVSLLVVKRTEQDQLREADDRVQRRPDFMAHIREKRRFGSRGSFGIFLSLPNLLLVVHPFGDINQNGDPTAGYRSPCPAFNMLLPLRPILIGIVQIGGLVESLIAIPDLLEGHAGTGLHDIHLVPQ